MLPEYNTPVDPWFTSSALRVHQSSALIGPMLMQSISAQRASSPRVPCGHSFGGGLILACSSTNAHPSSSPANWIGHEQLLLARRSPPPQRQRLCQLHHDHHDAQHGAQCAALARSRVDASHCVCVGKQRRRGQWRNPSRRRQERSYPPLWTRSKALDRCSQSTKRR